MTTARSLRAMAPARMEKARPLVGVEAYVWAFKQRAKIHHCIGYGTFQVEVDRCSALRKRFARLPLWLARLFHTAMTGSPAFYLKKAGTCGLTIMDAPWGDNFFPIGPASVVFSIGGVRPEPVVRDGQIMIRRMMNVCLGVDSFVVAGSLGAKLSHDFKNLIESGSFIEEELQCAR